VFVDSLIVNYRASIKFFTASRQVLETTQHPIGWLFRICSTAANRPETEAVHNLHLRVKMKNAWSFTSTSTKLSIEWPLIKKEQFYILQISSIFASVVVSLELNYGKRIQLKASALSKTTHYVSVLYSTSYKM
jgi:hypothetical protein